MWIIALTAKRRQWADPREQRDGIPRPSPAAHLEFPMKEIAAVAVLGSAILRSEITILNCDGLVRPASIQATMAAGTDRKLDAAGGFSAVCVCDLDNEVVCSDVRWSAGKHTLRAKRSARRKVRSIGGP